MLSNFFSNLLFTKATGSFENKNAGKILVQIMRLWTWEKLSFGPFCYYNQIGMFATAICLMHTWLVDSPSAVWKLLQAKNFEVWRL